MIRFQFVSCVALALVACNTELAVPGEAEIACSAEADCPQGWGCVEGLGWCADENTPCVEKTASGYVPFEDGNQCTLRSGEAGICLDARCGLSICGDGYTDTEAEEECDEGASNSDEYADACRANCRVAYCGDQVRDSDEECDHGAGNSDIEPNACRQDCRLPHCGDGVTDEGEVCDNGNTIDGDGCSADCLSDESCGNGRRELDEECDLGANNSNSESNACREDCRLAHCGDGVADDGEVCDNGNNLDGDGCSADCSSDESCGNSIIDFAALEICDDGDADPGDGCNEVCDREWGWYCYGEPSVCSTSCGDFFVAGNEACDDGNSTLGDGCNAACELEAGFACTGSPSTCARVFFVNADPSITIRDGTSWATAYETIGVGMIDAEAARASGLLGEVWVAAGTYGSFNLVSGVGVYGGFAGGEPGRDQRDWESNETIVQGVGCDGGGTLDGFTITTSANGINANNCSPAVSNCLFYANTNNGMFIQNGSAPIITNCVFEANGDYGVRISSSSPVITASIFTTNDGGGMMVEDIDGKFTGLISENDFVGNLGPGVLVDGYYTSGDHTDLTLVDCGFVGNQEHGIEIDYRVELTVDGCTFDGNEADRGGAIYSDVNQLDYGSEITVVDSVFTGNTATDYGGAIAVINSWDNPPCPNPSGYLYTPVLRLEGANSFTGNSAGIRGGAIYISGCHTELSAPDGSANVFDANTAGTSASAIHAAGYPDRLNRVTIYDATFTANDSSGVTIYTTYGSFDLFDSSLDGNIASAVIYVNESDAQIENTTFSNNVGTGLRVSYDAYDSSLTDCDFLGNTDGGVENDADQLTISGGTFRDNTKTGIGAGIENDGYVRVTGTSFINNVATGSGGAISSRGELWVRQSSFLFNRGYNGGAINIWDDDATDYCDVDQSLFFGNRAEGVGGALTVDSTNNVSLESCILVGNHASGEGTVRAMFNSSAVQLDNCTFLGNFADDEDVFYAQAGSGIRGHSLILWDHPGNLIGQDGATVAFTYSDVEGAGASGTNIDQNPLLANVPSVWDWTIDAGASNTVVVSDATIHAVDDVLEIQDDGVVRTITALDAGSGTITFAPPLDQASTAQTLVENWGPGATDLNEDYRLTLGSPCIDTGDPVNSPPIDFDGTSRVDGDGANGAEPDMGAFEFVP